MEWALVWDITQGIFMLVTIIGGFYLSTRKAPMERSSLDAAASKSYQEAARMAGEDKLKLEQELHAQEIQHDIAIAELREELHILNSRKYRVTVEFTIGNPPEPGRVTIEPIEMFASDRREADVPVEVERRTFKRRSNKEK
jgi:hypothetical protein